MLSGKLPCFRIPVLIEVKTSLKHNGQSRNIRCDCAKVQRKCSQKHVFVPGLALCQARETLTAFDLPESDLLGGEVQELECFSFYEQTVF